MHDNFGKNIEWRMPCFRAQVEHLLRHQKNMIYFLKHIQLLIFAGIVRNGPNHRQAQILLIRIMQSSFDVVHANNHIHDMVMHFFKESLYDCLQCFNIHDFFNDVHDVFPPIGHDMSVVDDQFVDCNYQLVFDLLELAID